MSAKRDGKVFFDTNILIYAVDGRDPGKQAMARERIRAAGDAGVGVVSTQVLQEFYVAATRKLGIEPLRAKRLVEMLTRFEVVSIQPDQVRSAIDLSILNQFSLWDSLVLVAASSANCAALVSEDLSQGQLVNGVRIVNPFSDR